MRLLFILQTILGAAIIIFSWMIVAAEEYTPRKNIPGSDHIFVNAPPPHTLIDYILLGLGVAVICCGLLLWKTHFKTALLQIISGAIISVIYLIERLPIQAFTVVIGDRHLIYYLAYLTLGLGAIIVVIGLAQMVLYWRRDNKTVNAQG